MSYFPTAADLTESKFIKKEDIPPNGAVVTITGFSKEEVVDDKGKNETLTVVHLDAFEKGWILKSTNFWLIADAYGEDYSKWIGKKIKLVNDPSVMFGTKRVGGIRVKTPSKPDPVDDFTSDVPF